MPYLFLVSELEAQKQRRPTKLQRNRTELNCCAALIKGIQSGAKGEPIPFKRDETQEVWPVNKFPLLMRDQAADLQLFHWLMTNHG